MMPSGRAQPRGARCLALCGLAALCALTALAACSRGAAPDEEFRIGLLVPLSGAPSLVEAQRAAEALVAQVNAEGGLAVGGRRLKVRLLVADTGGQVERVMIAASRLIRQERVSALVGPYYSREALPVADVAEQSQVPLVSPTASSPQVTQGRHYVFRVCLVDTVQGRVMARYAFEALGLRRAAVLYDEADAYSGGLARLFCDGFSLLGGQVPTRETYPTGASDFRAQLARIRASGAQALFLPNFTGDVPRQMAQARAAGFAGVFLGGDSWSESEAIFGLPQAEGAFFSSNFVSKAFAGQRAQDAELLKRQGIPLDSVTAQTLDALGVVLAAAQAAGSVDPVSLCAGIASLRGYEGFTGRLSFERGGDALRSAHVLVIEAGQARSRKELEPTP